MSEAVKIKLSKKDLESDQDVRWCPGCGDYAILATVQRTLAQLGVKRENTVFVSRHRLLEPVPVLHEHVRLPHDPRPRAGDRVGPQDHAPRARRVGDHRRRRRPVDRRQSHDPRAPAQHGSQDHPVQQPDLRAHQGPVLADLGARHARAVDADRLDRSPAQPDLARARRRRDVRRARGRHRREAAWARSSRRPTRHKGAVFIEMLQNCPVFNDGVWEGVKDDPAGKQILLVEGKPLAVRERHQGHQARRRPGARRSSTSATATPRQLLVHTEQRLAALRAPARAARAAGLPDADGRALSRTTSRRTSSSRTRRSPTRSPSRARAISTSSMYSGMVWEVGADGTRH